MKPLISVIVPVYNVEKYIRKCVSSLLSQTYENIEILLIDDGSTDNSGRICDSYNNSKIKVTHKENGGLSSARNLGLKLAKGEYIAFLDSDDYADEKMIETMYSLITENDCDVAQVGLLKFNENEILDNSNLLNKDYPVKILSGKEAYRELYFNGENGCLNFITWNKLYKKCLFENLEFCDGKNNEDVIMTSMLLPKIDKIVVKNIPLIYYLQRSTSIMGIQNSDKKKLISSHIDAFFEVVDYYETDYQEYCAGPVNYLGSFVGSYLKNFFKYSRFEIKNIKPVLRKIKNKRLWKSNTINKKSRLVFLVLEFIC